MIVRLELLALGCETTSSPFTRWTCRSTGSAPCVEVQVIPLQGQNFSTPQSCGQLQQEKLITAVFFGLN